MSAAFPLLLSCPAGAAKWDTIPTLSLVETYTDNVALTQNAFKQGDDSGEYLEVGYAYTMEETGIVLSATLVYSDQLPTSASFSSDYSLAFGIKKNFELK